jgi:hypothetical protein
MEDAAIYGMTRRRSSFSSGRRGSLYVGKQPILSLCKNFTTCP